MTFSDKAISHWESLKKKEKPKLGFSFTIFYKVKFGFKVDLQRLLEPS